MGNIQSQTILISPVGQEKWQVSQRQTFDIHGNLVSNTQYDHFEQQESKEEYRYYSDGKLKEQISYFDTENWIEKQCWKYDEGGLVVEKTILYEDGGKSISHFTRNSFYEEELVTDEMNIVEKKLYRILNEEGQLLKEVEYNADSEIERQIVQHFNAKGNLISREEYGEGPQPETRYTYQYDQKGREISCEGVSSEGNLVYSKKQKYDFDLLKEVEEQGYTTRFKYDSKKRLIHEEKFDPVHMPVFRRQLKYDRNGHKENEAIYKIGEEYAVEPQVMGRTLPTHIVKKYEYAYWE